MFELLLISQIFTADYFCYMVDANGQIINLEALCRGEEPASTVAAPRQGFMQDVASIVSITSPGAETRLGPDGWGVEELGQNYCDRRAAGDSKGDYYADVARLMLDSPIPDEYEAVITAVVQFAPEYYCPQFAEF